MKRGILLLALGIAIGLAIVAALGDDERAVSRVAGALPPGVDSEGLRVEVIGRMAATEPERAMRQALGLSDAAAQSQALQRVAEAWAVTDPASAVGQAGLIGKQRERQRFLAHIARD